MRGIVKQQRKPNVKLIVGFILFINKLLVQDAYNIGCEHGLAAMDALHIAAALSIGAEEFVTTEKLTKPMFRITSIQVISIFG